MWQEKFRKQKNVTAEQIWKTVEISDISKHCASEIVDKTHRYAGLLKLAT